MKTVKLLFILVLISASFYGCMRCYNNVIFTSKFVESFLGSYDFTMTDSLGNKIAEGQFRPKIFEDPDITGFFKVFTLYDDKFKSMLGTGGNFFGSLDEKNKKGFVNLNPKIADNNIFLRFSITDTALNGTWERSTMRGVVEKGIFTAVKSKE